MKGYVTVFFTISISLVLSLLIGTFYGARENAIRMKARYAMDASLNGIFAEYNRELFKQYGLLFVDMSYQSESDGSILTEEHFISFFNKNCDEKTGVISEGIDLLSINCVNAEIDKLRLASDNAGFAIREQATKYMERELYVSYIEDFIKYMGNYESFSIMAEEELDNYIDANDSQDKSFILDKANIETFTVEKEEEGELGLLSSVKLIRNDSLDISLVKFNQEKYPSYRALNEGNYSDEKGTIESIKEEVLFRKYLVEKCGCFTEEKENSYLKYQVEYLIRGYSEDDKNLESIINRLLLLREGINISLIKNNETEMAEIEAISLLISLILELEPETVQKIIIVGLATYRAVKDVKKLCNGEKIPLYDDPNIKFSYEDYLLAFLYFTNLETLTYRFMDVVEMDVRKNEKDKYFMIDKCFDTIKITAYVISDYGYNYEIERQKTAFK